MNIAFTCKELTTISIIISCDLDWSQDELPLMINQYFQQYPNLKKIEWSQGADLEAVRFKWQHHDFSLNFECYGQSIWLECPEHNGSVLLASLHQYLNEK
ncbi:MAG: DUF3630 family protein [Thalassotalea sp.]|nr:DUF3630 family protein [Thalassotalea sp.]